MPIPTRRAPSFVVLVAFVMACASGTRPSVSLETGRGEPVTFRPRRVQPVQLTQVGFLSAMEGVTARMSVPVRNREFGRRLMLGAWDAASGDERFGARLVRASWFGGEPGRLQRDSPLQRDLEVGYARLCQDRHVPGDCLGLFDDDPMFSDKDRQTLALRIALSSTFDSMARVIHGINPLQVETAVLTAMVAYMGLVLVPEPLSKLVAMVLTANLIAYLGVDLFHSLLLGYLEMRDAVARAESFEALAAAGHRFGEKLGPSAARIVVMLVTWGLASAVGNTLRIDQLPGAGLAAANGEVAGVQLGSASNIGSITVVAGDSVTITASAAVSGTWVAMQSLGSGNGANERDVETAEEEEADPSSRELTRALEAAGHVKPEGAATHHIVAGRAPLAARARGILQKFGIGLNEAENGVFLPRDKLTSNPTGAAVHTRVHTRDYYLAVDKALREATTKQEAIDILRFIARALESGGYP